MFHNSTTIWHKILPEKSFTKEARLCRKIGWWGGSKLLAKGIAKGIGTIAKYGWKFSTPGRTLLLFPLKVVWNGGKFATKAVDATEFSLRYGKNIGKIGGKTITKGFLAPAMGPVNFVKRNLYENSKLTFQGVANAPGNILTTHKRIGEGIAETRNDIKTSFKNMIAPGTKNPLTILNNTRKFTTKALTSPISAPLKIGWKAIEPFVPTKVMANTVGSFGEYPKALYNTYKGEHFKEGWSDTKAAYGNTIKEMGEDARFLNFNRGLGKFGAKTKEIATKNATGFRDKYKNWSGMAPATPAAAGATP